MTNKELRRLSRAELIDILFELQTQNENLTAENRELAAQLESRQLQITEAGSIAEASLQLNGVFQAAQDACAQYIENIEQLSTRQEQVCAQMQRETQVKCDRMIAEARSQSQAYWDDVSRKVQELTSSYAELRTILQQPQVKMQE